MINWMSHVLSKYITRASLGSLVVALGLLYLAGMVMIPLEHGLPAGSLGNYSWWFLITITTIGYGDIFPQTTGGRIVAAIIIVGGVGTAALILTKTLEKTIERGKRRMKGLVQLTENQHIVILGYHEGETQHIITELRSDQNHQHQTIVLCSNIVDINPLPDAVQFVKGDITTKDVFKRSCLAKAATIIVYGRDDSETSMAAIMARRFNANAHVSCKLNSATHVTNLEALQMQIECVSPMSLMLLTQAARNPGASRVFVGLISNRVDDDVCRVNIPDDVEPMEFGNLFMRFKQRYNATIIATTECHRPDSPVDLNPPRSTVKFGEACPSSTWHPNGCW